MSLPEPAISPPAPIAPAETAQLAGTAELAGGMEGGWKWPFALRALGSRNFRLFFSGQIVSLTGSWMTSFTNSWLIFHLTGSTFMLGLSALAAQIPAFVLASLAGVLVDRWDLRRTLVITQSLALLQSALLATLCWTTVLSERYMVGAIMFLQLFQGLINSVDIPARQSFGIQMVDRREDLTNAVALNSTMVNLSRLVGPAMAGGLIGLGLKIAGDHPRAGEIGAAWCYSLDVLSYIGVIWALVLMRPRALHRTVRRANFLAEFEEGFRYVAHNPALRTALLLLVVASFFGVSVNTQMAAIAAKILYVGPGRLGLLVGGVGAGATVSALYLATRRSIAVLPALISHASTVFGVALIALSLTQNYFLAVLLAPILGGSMVLQTASTNTLMQSLSTDDNRGRVMSLFTMSFMGVVPMGALAVGLVGERLPLKHAVLMFGSVVLVASLVAGPTLRRVKVG